MTSDAVRCRTPDPALCPESDWATDRPPSMAAVVVTCNRPAQLRATVEALLAAPLDRICIVDNGACGDAPDGTAAWLAGLHDPRLVLLSPPRNLGGAGGFALGLAELEARADPDWIVVMDDDARPAPGAIARFRAAPPAGWDAVAAAVRDPAGRIAEMNRPARNPFASLRRFAATLVRGRPAFHLTDADYLAETPTEIDIASFVGLFLSRRARQMGGLPDARLFIYGDDVLHSLHMRALGLRIGFDPRIRFEHDCRTLQGSAWIYRPLWKAYYHHRNLLQVFRAAAGRWLFGPVALVRLARWALRARHYRGPERKVYLRLLSLAVLDGVRGHLGRPHEEVLALAASARRPVPPQASARGAPKTAAQEDAA
ncbi:glycosyltransferase [Frigidibacter albus]|uniref:Glycosyltransferase n=2 Tax=Frigidibacter albus TaxID=1465486 RepID=A0A6L8VJF0_9RHOB|nr:glycosyltransferase [Frigidibacter albus]NBE31335.1 glycosyltransferase [Frigidibacter albus]GGH54108.1 hypothetical protein GCM10011341_20270 [Frigidibacter albus]